MTDRPMLFSGPMIRALLDGRKTQTRRLLKPQPEFRGGAGDWNDPEEWGWEAEDGGHLSVLEIAPNGFAPGDRLWVREAHVLLPATAYRMSIGTGTIAQVENPSDGHTAAVMREGFDRSGALRWRPSIHMPRWASRLTLAVTDVRVQRLQQISEADAAAEGAPVEELRMYPELGTAQHWFHDLWDSLNANRAPWASNPWVVALTFTVHRSNIDQMGGEA